MADNSRTEQKVKGKKEAFTSLLCEYLTAKGLASHFGKTELSPPDIASFQCAIEPLRRAVCENSPPDINSASENPLLALPYLDRQWLPDEDRTRILLERLRNLVTEGSRNNTANAKRFVRVYSDYGRNWDALAECKVPLDSPFLIKVSERRALPLREPQGGVIDDARHHEGLRRKIRRKRVHQLVNFADARTNHVSVRMMDASVELIREKWKPMDERYLPIAPVSPPDASEATDEIIAFYDAKPGRKERMWLELPLRPSSGVIATNLVILLLTLTAIVGFVTLVSNAGGIGGGKDLSGNDVAVLLVPSAVAAALLLVRHSTTLAAEVNRKVHYGVAVLLVGLWLLTLILYMTDQVSFGELENSSAPQKVDERLDRHTLMVRVEHH